MASSISTNKRSKHSKKFERGPLHPDIRLGDTVAWVDLDTARILTGKVIKAYTAYCCDILDKNGDTWLKFQSVRLTRLNRR